MLLRQLIDPVSSTFTYLLADESTHEGVIIDPVFEQHARDAALVRELGITLRYTLETHCHADHVTGAWLMKAAFGAQIVIAKAAGVENADVEVEHGDVLRFGGHSLEVRATPGHTDGCVTYVDEGHAKAFTGDCLLIRGAGRTDFQQGDAAQLYRSIREQIFSLPDSCAVYPAHDYRGRTSSSVAEERAHNPRVGGRASEVDFVGYMENLGLQHPKQIDVALPANLKCGKPDDGALPDTVDWGPVVMTYAGVPEIDPVWVAEHRDAVHVLDVRTASEVEGELRALEGAQHIPIGELRDRLSEVPTEKPVVAICRSGRRSAQAVEIMRRGGLSDVANIAGGMLRWRDRGLPQGRA